MAEIRVETEFASISIDDLPSVVKVLLEADLIPYLKGESGIGKTESVRRIAKDLGYDLVEINASNHTVEDFGAIEKRDGWATFLLNKLFDVKGPTIFYIDELSRGRGDLRNLFMGLMNERRIFGTPISDQIRFVLSANPNTAAYADTEDPFGDLAFARRVVAIEVETPVAAWCRNMKGRVNADIIRFIRSKPSALLTRGQACPRQWERVSRLYEKGGIEALRQLGRGLVGVYASTLVDFLSERKTITVEDVLKDYRKVASQYAKMEADGLVDEVRESKMQVAQNLLSADLKPTHKGSVTGFLLDLPAELKYNTCQSLAAKGGLGADWIDGCDTLRKQLFATTWKGE